VISKRVVQRERASRDIDGALEHYIAEAGSRAALGFIDALEAAYRHLGEHPASGSTRYAHELHLPGLRSWKLARYPYVIFYVEGEEHLDVWRVLNALTDIPSWLEPDG